MKRCPIATSLVALLLPGLALAQEEQGDRYQTGLRLRTLEAALEAHPEPASRKRAIDPLQKATFVFLARQTVEAGRLLDKATQAVTSEHAPDPVVAWGDSLAVRPAARLVDRTQSALRVSVVPYYRVDAPVPKKAFVRFQLVDPRGGTVAGPVEVPITALPAAGDLPLKLVPEGDYLLRAELSGGGKPLSRFDQGVSVVAELDTRLKALAGWAGTTTAAPQTTERETLRSLTRLLEGLRERKTFETDYPAARLLREAEELATAVGAGKPYYGPKRHGQFWLTLCRDGSSTPVRVQVPEAAAAGKPLPLVLALHGAGGSENLLFDRHGNGLAARLCAEHGWLLVAPRGRPPAGLLDEVARLYPVDRSRVFVFGHSMGAATAVELASRTPERFAAVAALGGGGGIKASERLRQVPFFVGVGDEDFALPGSRSLRDALSKAGVKKVAYREYPQVEHLLVVQFGLRDVFAFFDAAAAGGR